MGVWGVCILDESELDESELDESELAVGRSNSSRLVSNSNSN